MVEAEVVGLEELGENGYSVYPNPFSEVLRIQTPELTEDFQVTCYDRQGRLVEQATFFWSNGGQEFELPLAHLPQGQYLVAIRSEGTWWTRKVVKR